MASQTSISPANNAPLVTSGDDNRIEQPDMRNMAFALFRARTPMSDDHWKQVGALLQKANEQRLKAIYQEPLASSPGSVKPESRNSPRTSRPVQECVCAVLHPSSRQ